MLSRVLNSFRCSINFSTLYLAYKVPVQIETYLGQAYAAVTFKEVRRAPHVNASGYKTVG